MSDLYSFHGARCVDLARHPVIRHSVDHPEGERILPPAEGLGTAICGRCAHEFFHLPVDLAPGVCRSCASALQHAEDERDCLPWLQAIGADGLGLSTSIVGTGGGCTAIAVDLGGGASEHSYTGSRFFALVTHPEDASVPDGPTGFIGIYDAAEDEGCGEAHADLCALTPEEGADFLFLWADRLLGLDRADADTLQRWGIDPGRRSGFGAIA